jgi:hypothetical protein
MWSRQIQPALGRELENYENTSLSLRQSDHALTESEIRDVSTLPLNPSTGSSDAAAAADESSA